MFTPTSRRSLMRILVPVCALQLMLALGMAHVSAQGLAMRGGQWNSEGAARLTGVPPSASLGLRYHMTERHDSLTAASGVPGFGGGTAPGTASPRIGVEWQPSKSTLGFEHSAIGMQLDSNVRLSLRARHGGPMLYLRNRF